MPLQWRLLFFVAIILPPVDCYGLPFKKTFCPRSLLSRLAAAASTFFLLLLFLPSLQSPPVAFFSSLPLRLLHCYCAAAALAVDNFFRSLIRSVSIPKVGSIAARRCRMVIDTGWLLLFLDLMWQYSWSFVCHHSPSFAITPHLLLLLLQTQPFDAQHNSVFKAHSTTSLPTLLYMLLHSRLIVSFPIFVVVVVDGLLDLGLVGWGGPCTAMVPGTKEYRKSIGKAYTFLHTWLGIFYCHRETATGYDNHTKWKV